MDPLVIIGCGKAKRTLKPDECVPIVELYKGSLYHARLAYARALGGPHYVLSAAHGLARVDYEVTLYDADLRKMSKRERDAWSDRVFAQVARAVDHDGDRKIIALVAGPYADWTRTARARGYTVDVPAEGLPVGLAIRWLRNAADVVRGEIGDDEGPLDFEREAEQVLEEIARKQVGDGEVYELSVGALRVLAARARKGRAA